MRQPNPFFDVCLSILKYRYKSKKWRQKDQNFLKLTTTKNLLQNQARAFFQDFLFSFLSFFCRKTFSTIKWKLKQSGAKLWLEMYFLSSSCKTKLFLPFAVCCQCVCVCVCVCADGLFACMCVCVWVFFCKWWCFGSVFMRLFSCCILAHWCI